MAGNLTNKQHEWILKQYWKTENGLFSGGAVKHKVFARTAKNPSQFSLEACQEIDANKDLCSRVCMSVSSRLE